MWTCPKCQRIFVKTKQPHSCQKIPLEQHFKHKEKAKVLFDLLLKAIYKEIGPCKIISLPCCIHLFGNNDFLAALPKKNMLEIRFALDRVLTSQRLKVGIAVSAGAYKNCIHIGAKTEIDTELISWLRQSYNLKGTM